MTLTLTPPISVGSSSIVFLIGMPSAAAGPVAEMVTPTVISLDCASAGDAAASKTAADAAEIIPFNISFLP